MPLSPDEIARFHRTGFLIRPGQVEPARIATLRELAQRHLQARIAPLELEAEVDYPGSPTGAGPEGATIRRLLQARDRDPLLAQWFDEAETLAAMTQLLGGPVRQTRAHHNCVMSKQPRYSSDTLWHQDVRYWRFTDSELISVWLPLGPEHRDNGCLRVLPGSHLWQITPEQLDERSFFRTEHPVNAELIKGEQFVELAPGAVLYFHARLLHAATRNYSDETKLAVVGSYRRLDNLPVPGTRSAQLD